MPNTFGDFWKMILEKNCSIIVMITNVKEKGRVSILNFSPTNTPKLIIFKKIDKM